MGQDKGRAVAVFMSAIHVKLTEDGARLFFIIRLSGILESDWSIGHWLANKM